MNVFFKLRVLSILLVIALVVGTMTTLATEMIATTSETTAGIGNYSVKLPDSELYDDAQTYDVTLGLISVYNGGYSTYNNQVYYVTVTGADGEKNTTLSAYYEFVVTWNDIHSLSERVVTIADVPEGSTVTVENILVVNKEYDAQGAPLWTNYDTTYMAATVANPNSNDVVLINYDADLIELEVGITVIQTTEIVEQSTSTFVRDTDDTLLSVLNEQYATNFTSYSDDDFLTTLLSSYNVVSFDEINSTHIVGPIIAQNIAQRTAENGSVSGALVAGDYSSGIPSYVGDFSAYGSAGSEQVGVLFSYYFDFVQNLSFIAPNLYTDAEDDLLIALVGETTNLQDFYVLKDYDATVLSANHSGLTETYQSDDFIDFTTTDSTTSLQDAMIAASKEILEDGNAEGTTEYIRYEFNDDDGTVANATITVYVGDAEPIIITSTNGASYDGRTFSDFVTPASYYSEDSTGIRLTINMEESWTIVSAINLEEVNLITPEDYDYYDNPYLSATTINFDCEYINKTWYEFSADLDGDGVDESVSAWHSVMPYTLINGDEFTETQAEDGEYGEVGNKIIWNMPYVVTDTETGDNRLTVLNNAHNIAGHIIAPQAEFWNYDKAGNWLGGNLNGTAIVQSFNSGTMEMHMWAYTGLAEEAVVFGVDALKTVNDAEPEQEYTFILDVVYEGDGSIPDGIMNNVFPMYATSSIDADDAGAVNFSSIAFNGAGTYSFIIKEDTSADTATDNIIYDQTQYRIDITVEITSETGADTTVYEVTNVEKYMIVDSVGNEIVNPEEIDEVLDAYEFTFNNTISDADNVSLTLYKYCSTGHALSGAKFYITEMDSTGTTVLTDGYFDRATSATDGTILITELEKSTYYKIYEYESAYGHTMTDHYWVFYINDNGFLESFTEYDAEGTLVSTVSGNISSSDLIIYNDPEESALLDLVLTKSNELLDLLSNVGFTLQRVVINSDGEPETVVGGYKETYTSDVDGTFSIFDLESDHIYMLTEDESTTPDGHKTHTGYWLIEVSGNALHPSDPLTYTITEYDANHNVVSAVSNDIILNDLIDYVLPTTGGAGNTIFYITGIGLMLAAVMLYRKKYELTKKRGLK